jgi:putative endonuclease
MRRQFYVYILTNASKTLYVGVTNNLQRRLFEHRSGTGSSFCIRYNIKRLVYFEVTDDAYAAISREKQLKAWPRERKIALIKNANPRWRDLSKAWDRTSRPSLRSR